MSWIYSFRRQVQAEQRRAPSPPWPRSLPGSDNPMFSATETPEAQEARLACNSPAKESRHGQKK